MTLLERAQKTLPDIKDEAALRGLRESLKPYVWSDDIAWSYLKVTCPEGGECPFLYAVRDSYLADKFGKNKEAADKWSLRAMAEGVEKYQQAIAYAIKKAKPTDDGSFAGKGKRWLKSFTKGHSVLDPIALVIGYPGPTTTTSKDCCVWSASAMSRCWPQPCRG